MVFNYLLVFVAGFVFAIFSISRLHVGTIVVDWTNPEKDVYRIELANLGLLEKRKYVLFNVSRTVDDSQK